MIYEKCMSLHMKKKYSIAFGLRYSFWIIVHFSLDYVNVEYIYFSFSTSTHNNSLSRLPILLCITSCFTLCFHITVSRRLSSFYHVSDSTSLSRCTSDLVPPSLGVGFHCEGIRERVKSDRNNFEFG